MKESIEKLDHEIVDPLISHSIQDIKEKYNNENIDEYLEEVLSFFQKFF